MSGKVPERYLTRRDLEIIIRRASEIEASIEAGTEAQPGGGAAELSEDDVVRIATDVGLSEESVRRALAEHDSGVPLLVERGSVARLCGPGLVKASRRVPESAEAAQARLESHFESNEGLQLVRRVKGGSLWEPESGIVASVARSLDLYGRGYQLASNARAVEIAIVPLAEDACHVTLTADLGNQRAGWFWGLGVGAGTTLAGTAVAFIVGLPTVPALAAVAVPAVLGGTLSLARVGYRRAVDKIRLVLDGLLDRLEHGESLPRPKPSWRNLLK